MPDERSSLAPTQHCPLCGEANACPLACGDPYKGSCWCEEWEVPGPVLRFLAEGHLSPACLCRPCLSALAEHAKGTSLPAEVLARVREERSLKPRPGEFYLDECGRMVFTAEFHLRRGYCCESGCRHCPY